MQESDAPMQEDDATKVGRYYDEVIFDAEQTRLNDEFPIEFAMTSRYIERYVPAGSVVAEVGVGGGQYSDSLARRGCRLMLIDVSQKLLAAVLERIPDASAYHASATHLPLDDDCCEVVLLLGPLYHLTKLEDRQRAVAEASRVLRPGGVLLAAGINRLTYPRELFHQAPESLSEQKEFMMQYLQDGNVNPEVAPPLGYGHLTTVEEFRALFSGAFEEVKLLAVESFAAPWQSEFKSLTPEVAEAWLDIIERTAEDPAAYGLTDHYLYIGRGGRGS